MVIGRKALEKLYQVLSVHTLLVRYYRVVNRWSMSAGKQFHIGTPLDNWPFLHLRHRPN